MNLKKTILGAFLYVCFAAVAIGQSEVIPITWKILADVKFKEEYNKEFDFNVLYPTFGPKVKALENKWVEIEGYAIPISELGYEDILVLSGLPYSQCFFCGAAGPESVMDIKPKKKPKNVKLDKKLRFRGRLKLNERDLSMLNYVLLDAELVE